MSGHGFTVRPVGGDRWQVYLPHQCDTWDIVGEASYGKDDAETRQEAVEQLQAFIAEAASALEHLQRGEPFGEQPFSDRA